MSIIVLESPYSGNIPLNIAYAQRAMRDARSKGEIVIAPHLTWTQHPEIKEHFVADGIIEYEACSREKTLEQIHILRRIATKVVFYTDYGISNGMEDGLKQCKKENINYEIRKIENLKIDIENSNRRLT